MTKRIFSREDYLKRKNDEYIQTVKEVHGDRYDYSKTIFKSYHDYVTITCRIHGDFSHAAYSHIKGSNCPECTRIKNHEKRKLIAKANNSINQEEFIKRAIAAHGDKYDYTKTIYKGHDQKVIITCPIHGDFEQNPREHCRGRGCYQCGRTQSQLTRIANKIKIHDGAHVVKRPWGDDVFIDDMYVDDKDE